MKKMNKILLCAVGATMLFSCVKENFEPQENPVPDGYEMQEFTATSYSDDLQSSTSKPSNAQTKTTVVINDDGTHGDTHWAKGDQLSIFWDGGKGTADLEGEGGSSIGKFKGAVESGKLATHAVYPSSVEASVDGNTVKVAIPAQQNGTFSAGNISVAEVAEDNKLSFNNINAFLCVQLVSGDITKITIESVGGQPIVGTIPVTFTDGNAECGEVENGASKVTMTKAVGETGRYYVSIVPGVTHTEGLLMTYYKGDEETGSYQLNKQLAPVANKIYNFGEFEPDYNYYVTKDGAGKKTGVTWRDAMSIAQMVEMAFEDPAKPLEKVLDDKLNGATFHIEEGVYELDKEWRNLRFVNEGLVKLTFMGSYDKETHKRDLENSKTAFTGNNKHAILDVDCDDDKCSDLDITFDGIGFVDCELPGKYNAALFSYCGKGEAYLTIKNCYFTGHSNIVDGADAAALSLTSLTQVTIENTLFADNIAVSAPAMSINNTTATITNCRFENNEATENAGAVYVTSYAKPTFDNCVFTDNKALKWGTVQHDGGTTTFNNCTFTNNAVNDGWDGGAIAVCKNSTGSVKIKGGEISGNHAGWGAAIYQDILRGDEVASIYASDVVIKNNSNAGSGTIFANGFTELTRCIFDGNTAAAENSDEAIAIVVAKGGQMQMYGCTVQNHSSSGDIPPVLVRGGSSLYVGDDTKGNRSLFKNNVGNYSGAIRVSEDNSKVKAILDIESTTFEENNGKEAGAIYAGLISDLTLSDVVFEKNYVTVGSGGAVRFNSTGELICQNTSFIGNHLDAAVAQNRGGALSVDHVNGCEGITIDNCIFKDNYTNRSGGAAIHLSTFAEGKVANITNTVFENNYNQCKRVTGGENDSQSGAVLLDCHGIINFEDCVFTGNHTDAGSSAGQYTNGGAVEMYWDGLYAFNHCRFEGNYAARGGALYSHNSDARIYLNACAFTGNWIGAHYGTTIFIEKAKEFAMNNCSFADDTYSTYSGSTGTKLAWLDLYAVSNLCISNSSILGHTYNSQGQKANGSLLSLDLAADTKANLINNVIVNFGTDNNYAFGDLSGSKFNYTFKLNHTKYSSFDKDDSRISFVENPKSNGFSEDSFGDLEWKADDGYWYWNGTMTDGGNTSMITRDQFVSALNEANPDFKAWLESKGELERDQLGGIRGNGDWWPGAYQGSAASSVKITTFNLRSSTMDENAASKTWSNRKAGVYEWFNTNQSAIVAAQECTDEQRRDILANCSDYGAVYYERQSSWWDQLLGKDVDAPVVTFYKKSDVAVNSSGTFWLVEGAPTSPEESENQHQERCATWMKCTYKGVKMVVINAHLSYRTKAGEVEQSEPMQTLRQHEMDVITGWIGTNITDADGPVVLLGDFNIDHNNAIFNYYKNGTNGFYYGRAEAKNTDMGRTFNNWYTECDDKHEDWKKQKTIDHQFFKGFRSIDSYLVDRNTYAGVELISDHWPLTAVYKF